MDFSHHIKPLTGEIDWLMWKKEIRDLLDYHEKERWRVIDGKLKKPESIDADAQESVRKQHKKRTLAICTEKQIVIAKSMMHEVTVTDAVSKDYGQGETAFEAWESLRKQFEALQDQLFKICTEFCIQLGSRRGYLHTLRS
ncbi:uncharacterized protein TNCV_601171 [Trichonephila clavipes]|nr:uncharacterized protein TNCV_601171 [Trichonephila clavipes]